MTAAPERIYNWLDTQMSIARYWGGVTYMGLRYCVAPTEEGAPLVRVDVIEREKREKKAELKKAKQLEEQKNKNAQGALP